MLLVQIMSENLANTDDVPQLSNADIYYLASLYGIKSHQISFIKRLPSYDDAVFHISIFKEFIDEKKGIIPIVLKCSICNSFDRIDMQIKVMQRLNANNVPSPHPMLLQSAHAQKRSHCHPHIYITTNYPLKNESNPSAEYKVNVHAMSFIEGGMMAADIDKTNVSLLQKLGESIGELSMALKGFEHRASDFEFDWDLQYALNAVSKLRYIRNERQRKLIQIYMNHYINHLLPSLIENKLPKSIIHGDLNDLNMFVNLRGNEKRIIAFFDLGDCKLSCTIFDVAICCAYFMLNHDKETARKIMFEILTSYDKMCPLTNDEMNVFFVAVCCRIMVSALIGTAKIAMHPENAQYLSVHSKPSWTFLEQFADTKPVEMAKIIRQKLRPSKL